MIFKYKIMKYIAVPQVLTVSKLNSLTGKQFNNKTDKTKCSRGSEKGEGSEGWGGVGQHFSSSEAQWGICKNAKADSAGLAEA